MGVLLHQPGRPVVDNRGDDEFTRFLDLPGADRSWWEANGFGTEVIDTEFAFESTDDARRLLSRYLGRSVEDPPLRLDYRVGLFTATA